MSEELRSFLVLAFVISYGAMGIVLPMYMMTRSDLDDRKYAYMVLIWLVSPLLYVAFIYAIGWVLYKIGHGFYLLLRDQRP